MVRALRMLALPPDRWLQRVHQWQLGRRNLYLVILGYPTRTIRVRTVEGVQENEHFEITGYSDSRGVGGDQDES